MDVEPRPATKLKWIESRFYIESTSLFFSNRVRQLAPLATGRNLQKIFGGPLAPVRLPTSSESGSLLLLESSW